LARVAGVSALTLVVSGNVIRDNLGVGLYAANLDVAPLRSTATITGNQFINNAGDGWTGGCSGGGLRVAMDATITNNFFANNGRLPGSATCVDGLGMAATDEVIIRNNDTLRSILPDRPSAVQCWPSVP
jgi:hypothetical protein